MKGSEFCRAGTMCHLQLHVQRVNASSHSSLMYEVLADQTMWAVCGRTAGKLSISEAIHTHADFILQFQCLNCIQELQCSVLILAMTHDIFMVPPPQDYALIHIMITFSFFPVHHSKHSASFPNWLTHPGNGASHLINYQITCYCIPDGLIVQVQV